MVNAIKNIYLKKFKPLLGSASFHILVSTVSVALIFLMGDFVFTRKFSQEDFGTWRQVMLIVGLGTSLISIGIPEGYRYFISYDRLNGHAHAKTLIISTFGIAIIFQIVLMAGGMGLIAKGFNNPDLLYFVYTLPIIFIVVTLSRAIRYLMINNNHTIALYRYSIISIFLSAIVIAATWFMYDKLSKAQFWYWMSGFVSLVYLVLFLPYFFDYKNSKTEPTKYSFSLKPYLKIGFPIYIATFVGVLTLNIDKTIVSGFTDTVTFAIYAIGAIEIPLVGMIGASIAQKIFPTLVSLYKENNIKDAKALWLSTTLKSTHVTYPVILLMMIFSKPLILILFTEKYIDAVPIFQTYLLLGLWRNTQYGSLIIASGKTKWTFYYSVLCLIFSVGLSILLYYLFGVIGVAWGAFLAFGFIAILQLNHESLLKDWFRKIILNRLICLEIICIFITYLIYNQFQ